MCCVRHDRFGLTSRATRVALPSERRLFEEAVCLSFAVASTIRCIYGRGESRHIGKHVPEGVHEPLPLVAHGIEYLLDKTAGQTVQPSTSAFARDTT